MERTARPSPILALAALFVVIAGLKLASGVLIPLALALLLAFLLAPIASRLQRLGLGRGPSVVVVVVLVFAAAGLLGWLLTGELTELADNLPQYQHNLHARLQSVRQAIEPSLQKASDVLEEVGKELVAPGAAEPETVQVRDA